MSNPFIVTNIAERTDARAERFHGSATFGATDVYFLVECNFLNRDDEIYIYSLIAFSLERVIMWRSIPFQGLGKGLTGRSFVCWKVGVKMPGWLIALLFEMVNFTWVRNSRGRKD